MDKTSFFTLTCGLYIVSSKSGEAVGGHSACIVNTVQQVSSDPPRLCVTLAKTNLTHDAVVETGMFSAAVLSRDVPLELIQGFGFRTSRGHDKFASIGFGIDGFGMKYPLEFCLSRFSCALEQTVDLGTHTMLAGKVIEAEKLPGASEPLTYAYYHAFMKGGAPKAAPSYRPPSEAEEKNTAGRNNDMKKYVCQVCGYVYDEAEKDVKWEELPEDYVCPMCGADKDMFEEA